MDLIVHNEILPAVNQIETHPFNHQIETQRFVEENKVQIESWGLFAEGNAKMLSKELQNMEMNYLVSRTVLDTKPITVEYKITKHGKTLEPIIDAIASWGLEYRKSIYGASKRWN